MCMARAVLQALKWPAGLSKKRTMAIIVDNGNKNPSPNGKRYLSYLYVDEKHSTNASYYLLLQLKYTSILTLLFIFYNKVKY